MPKITLDDKENKSISQSEIEFYAEKNKRLIRMNYLINIDKE